MISIDEYMDYLSIQRLINYFKNNWIKIILIILSIYDLRTDIRLLLDFFTFSTFFYSIYELPLAITVLITIPSTLDTSIKD